MNKEKKVIITLNKQDTYLDLSYYKVSILYWDKEEVQRNNVSCFKIGNLIVNLLDELDSTGQELEIEFKIKNNPSDLLELLNLSGQKEGKVSKLKSAVSLTESTRDANRLKEFVRCVNVYFS